jgi:DNA-binding transcriptional LysR family regulator
VPALPRFLERYPEIEVELSVEDRTTDVVKEGYDIAVRTGQSRDASLVVRKICDLERVICASPAYLARHGVPRIPDDLARHNCITVAGTPSSARWPFATPSGEKIMAVSGNIAVNNVACVMQLAIMGLGIVRVNEVTAGEEIRKGTLVSILTGTHRADPVPLHAAYPHGKYRLPRVAAMLDFLMQSFGHAPWRAAPMKAKQRS